jgi:anaerobic ribonucleoside-triphosphate reductase
MATRERNEPAGSGLFVQTSDEDLIRWNRQRIVNALLRETDLPRAVAVEISREIQETIGGTGLRQISTTLIRELVDIKLIERGFEQQHARHTRIGLPVFDTENLITRGGPASSPALLGPEATNRALAESIKRDFALLSLFSDRVAVAHRRGDIHLEHLGQVDRPHSCLISPEYIKKFGLSLPGTLANARPARQPEVLLAHLARFSAFLQGHFSNSIAWDLINVYLAPFLRGLSDREVTQLAQFLVYEFSQLSAARDNRPIFCDLHVYWGIPRALRKIPALGPAGEETGKPYGEYGKEAKAFARALVEVMAAGDGDGSPFFYPTPVIRLDGSFTREPGSGGFLRQAAELAVRQGTPLFLFDRGSGMQVTNLGPWESGAGTSTWTRRCHSLQAITVNLPRLAYRAAGSDETLRACLEEVLELCATAHLEKRIFLEKLLAYGKGAPLSLLLQRRDGAPLLDLDRTSHLIGLSGLNEMVQIHTGHEMHRGRKSHTGALQLLRHIAGYCREMSARHRVVFHPAESFSRLAPARFARKDLRYHSPQSGHVVKGELSAGEVHYTRSVRVSGQAGVDLSRRLALESEFHPFLPGGALFEVPLDAAPSTADAVRFIRRVYSDTLCSQLAFSPRFSYCADCHRATGPDQACPGCGAIPRVRIERRGIYYAKPEAGDLADVWPDRRRQRYGAEAFRNKK